MPVNLIPGKISAPLTGAVEAVRVSAFKNTISSEKALFTGQILNAVIAERLGPDHLVAIISGQAYNLRLPVSAVSGEAFQLEVVATEPKLLFRLLNPNVQADIQHVTVSDTARWIRSTGETLPNTAGLVAKTRIEPPSIPLDQPGATAELADNLRSAVSQSGLFYESHQAQWIEGKYPIDTLRQEPQANTEKLLSTLPHNLSTGAAASQTQENITNSNTLPSSLPPQQAQPNLVEQQLATLAGSPIELYGQAWPGQTFRLSVQRDNEPKPFVDTALSEWQSHLTLDLPNLGTVDATLHLSQAGVRITLHATDQASLEALRASSSDLVDTLASMQIKVLNLGLALTNHDG